MFKNTPLSKSSDQGRTYGACGREAVTNLGCQHVKCAMHDGIHTSPFQVGDRITRGLLVVSQLASLGAGIWLGPAPAYKSHIVWDNDAFIAAAGPNTSIYMNNGTYKVTVREAFVHRGGDASAMDASGENVEGEAPVSVDPSGGSSGSMFHRENGEFPEGSTEVEVSQEEAPVKVIRAPDQPTPEELDRHYATGHVPFRSWCPVCVAASATDAGHYRSSSVPHEFPAFSADYGFLGTKEKSDKLTIFVVRESKSKNIFSTVVPPKRCRSVGTCGYYIFFIWSVYQSWVMPIVKYT